MPAVSAMALLRHLGDDSALVRLARPWPLSTHIAVRTLEEVNFLTRVTMRAAGAKPWNLPPAIVIPRPDRPAAEPEPTGWVNQLLIAQGVSVQRV